MYIIHVYLLMRLTYNQIETFLKPIFLLRKIYKHSIQNDNITPIKKNNRQEATCDIRPSPFICRSVFAIV